MKYVVHTDGGARGNPGPAAIGVVIETAQGKKIAEFGKRIGETTNNVAEYVALAQALKYIKREPGIEIDCYLDSVLVVNQLMGTFKVKDSKLRELLMQIRGLEQDLGGVVRYHVVPRENNARADFFVNQALDNHLIG